jgi:hypothetical protein
LYSFARNHKIDALKNACCLFKIFDFFPLLISPRKLREKTDKYDRKRQATVRIHWFKYGNVTLDQNWAPAAFGQISGVFNVRGCTSYE